VIIVSPPSSPPPAPANEEKPALPGDWTREVAITQETLRKIWELIEADRPKPGGPAGNGA
jgi:hypothetical protein